MNNVIKILFICASAIAMTACAQDDYYRDAYSNSDYYSTNHVSNSQASQPGYRSQQQGYRSQQQAHQNYQSSGARGPVISSQGNLQVNDGGYSSSRVANNSRETQVESPYYSSN